MEKRLNRTDYVFALTFIFMLVVALGAFFYGLRLGQERSDAKYEGVIAKKNEEAKGYTAYDQQYLVSYYHTIYQPYREFHKKWFEKMDELTSNKSTDGSMALKELAKLADETYSTLSGKTMPDSSPLLQDGLKDNLRSLKLFGEALTSHASKANAQPTTELVSTLDRDAYIIEAKNFALKADKEYYDAILKWNETINPQFKPIDVSKPLALKEWSALSLNMKNDYCAQLLIASKLFKAFTPQDLAARIDEMIANGQTAKMNLTGVAQVVDVLMATDAVRPGDFLRYKSKWYANETLPQLPFFTN